MAIPRPEYFPGPYEYQRALQDYMAHEQMRRMDYMRFGMQTGVAQQAVEDRKAAKPAAPKEAQNLVLLLLEN
jgi:hypothetical protein